MNIAEVIRIARRNSDILFTREFYKENGFSPREDVYRVNIKGRVNKAFEEYNPYESITFHTDHLVADDWVVITKEECARVTK